MPRPSSSSFEAAVRGATKVKLASPKAKYCQQILLATQSGDAGVAEVFRTLTHRLRDSTWTVAFKALIIVHLMIKEGAQDVTLRYLAVSPRNRLAINSFTDVQTQGQNIRVYSEYLLSRAMGFERTKCDHVRSGEGRMKRLSVDKGLLRETEAVQDQIKALVKCDLLNHDTENEISLTAFRLLTRDLLDLYNVENEAVMNVLSRYFEMSRPDAERAIRIYKVFCKQTEQVVAYLSVARQYEYATRLEIPKLKHAPTSLAASLQEYLDDKDFEINRRQYLAEQDAKKGGRPIPKPSQSMPQLKSAAASTPFGAKPASATTTSQPAKGPAPDLIDFFASIDQQQTPMDTNTNPFLRQQQSQPQMSTQMTGFQQPQQQFGLQPQMTGFGGSQNYQFNQPQQLQQQPPQPLQSQSTEAGFGGYGPQPTQQQQPFPTGNAFAQDQSQLFGSPSQAQQPAQLQPQTTNPFRLSMMQTGGNFASGFNQPPQQPPQLQPQPTGGKNPFARSALPPAIPENEPTSPVAAQQSYQPQPLQPQITGTNPFARNKASAQQTAPAPAPLQVQNTGSTNPFRQSQFVNQQTGQGWQNTPQATMGGLEQLPTMPVFPRPGTASAQPQQQQPQQSWI
ncbi:ENTH domain-containing protein [Zymoseptoria brevis]|uniref:ENTH domain-containing protein n=1 Tax=Zymoseptoria brevis TaxID=1047168 RepID=A0A0F4GRV5_9PEZI|nr:ENTH domain-containing protein [Zymoseptoria brevis]